MGYSWGRDPTIRARADSKGWRLAPPKSEIQAEIDKAGLDPSKFSVEIEAVALVKARRVTLIIGGTSLLIGIGGLISRG